MHAMRLHRAGAAISILAAACLLASSPAYAKRGPGGSDGGAKTSGTRSGNTLESRITYSGRIGGINGTSTGNVAPIGNWNPPACWYEPVSAKDFQNQVESQYAEVVNDPRQPNYAKAATGQFRNTYKDDKYKNYNLDKADEGNWWIAVQDPNRLDDPGAFTCDKLPFWVRNGDTPAVQNAITPQVLAELAYSRILLPDTKVTLAPQNVTKVNLPTWAWLDPSAFKPVQVTASLNAAGLNIQATTTAKPVSLKLQPGTADAETYPASGECAINNDGSIGESYTRGKSVQAPPCGIKYLRSSGNGPFNLKATITWRINWIGTGGAGGELPDGTFGATQDVTVQEIQAVNR